MIEKNINLRQAGRKVMKDKNWLQNFTKSETDRWIAGICGGLGEQTPVPSWTWRLLFVLLFLIGGSGLLIYILLWIFVPRRPPAADGNQV